MDLGIKAVSSSTGAGIGFATKDLLSNGAMKLLHHARERLDVAMHVESRVCLL